MNFGFKLVEVRLGSRASIYTVQIEDCEKTELDSFLAEMSSQVELISDDKKKEQLTESIQFLANRIYSTIPENGALGKYFEFDGSPTDAVEKLKHSQLRLFCLRFGKLLVIFGGGGIKEPHTRTTRESTELQDSVDKLKYVESRIRNAQQQGRFSFDDTGVILHGSVIKFEPL